MKMLEFNPKKETTDEQVFRTYQNLRVGLCVIGVMVPIMVWFADYIELGEVVPRPSISAYYHSEHSLTRDLFVSNLFVVGIFLLLYRGYSAKENIALDIGGMLLTGVAIFPTQPDPEKLPQPADRTFIQHVAYAEYSIGEFSFTLHGACAVGFFLAIAYVAIFLAGETVQENPVLKRIYFWLGVAMLVAPLASFLFVSLIGENYKLFLLESVGILVFSIYWAVKTWEFWGTGGKIESKQFD
ncbi:MAG: hypothetical protein KDB22_26570 [Planctomycetales bacterium]|nr:hypothetical protein [Planctomycetales bacterium]